MKIKFLTLVTLILITLVSVQETNAQNNQKQDLPTGDWSISFHSYQGDDYLYSPVTIYSVSSKDASVTSFTISNISTKSVKAIRLQWMVHKNDNRKEPILTGKSSLIKFTGVLESGKAGVIRRNIVDLFDFANKLFPNGKLDDHINIDLRVIEVQFEDNSAWSLEQGKSDDIKYEYEQKMMFSSDCPKQKCKSSPSSERRNGTTYSCEASSNKEVCTVASNVESCTNSTCNGGSGGSSTPELPTDS